MRTVGKLCAARGCGAVTFARYCPNHRTFDVEANRRKHAHPRNRIYDSAAWKRTRKIVFARDGHVCAHCGREGNIVDHINGVLNGNPFDPDGCQVLCHRCSGAKDGARASQRR
jgi:5-methylcytosine-specific restriction protein A